MIRTPKLPFIESIASLPVLAITTLSIIIGTIIPYTFLGNSLGMSRLPYTYFPWLLGIVVCYMVLATIMKSVFRKNVYKFIYLFRIIVIYIVLLYK